MPFFMIAHDGAEHVLVRTLAGVPKTTVHLNSHSATDYTIQSRRRKRSSLL